MVLSLDGRWLYVMCEASDEVRVVDTQTKSVARTVAVGHMPRGIALSPEGTQLFVANSWDDTVSVVDTAQLKVVRTLATGFEPNGVMVDRQGKTLYVANRLSNDVSVIDLQSGQETKRLLAGRGASYLALTPDGKLLYCTHAYPKIGAHRTPPESEVTVIDTQRQEVIERKALHNVAGVFHIALSADGKLGVAPQLRPKNLIPLAHVEHGWVFGDSLAVFGDDVGGVVQVPIDELERYFAMPFAAAITPDKRKLYVSSSGSEAITVIDIPKMIGYVKTAHGPIANDLSASANYVVGRIPVGRNPKGLVLSRDGTRLFVANRLDDSIGVIDTANDVVVSSIDLGGRKDMTSLRRGERISIPPVSPSRANLVAQIAISTRRSTDCNGTWSRTASEWTSWTIARSKTCRAPSRSSGMAETPTWRPSAGRGRKSISIARRVITAGNWPTWFRT